jgi:polar amino acid transport system substrate-binding protein
VIERAIRAAFVAIGLCAVIGCSGHAPKTQSPSTSGSAFPGGDMLSSIRQRGTIVIATDANYSPQSFRAPDGTWSGFDVEVGKEIARRLGVRPVFEAVPFNLIVRGHWPGKWDLSVGSMSITSERTKVLWFTKPYYSVPGSIAVSRSSDITAVQDLKGKKIGVTAATTFQSFLNGTLGGRIDVKPLHLHVVPYDTDIQALRDLARGHGRDIDAVMTSLPTIQTAIHDGLPIRVVGTPVFGDRPAIALDRSSTKEPLGLLFATDAIIDEMHSDGTLRRLSLKYYGMDLSKG